jgi:hypothetical protein
VGEVRDELVVEGVSLFRPVEEDGVNAGVGMGVEGGVVWHGDLAQRQSTAESAEREGGIRKQRRNGEPKNKGNSERKGEHRSWNETRPCSQWKGSGVRE